MMISELRGMDEPAKATEVSILCAVARRETETLWRGSEMDYAP